YRRWAKKNNFESKLEDDIKTRKQAAADAAEVKAKLHQETLEPHLREKPARVVPYSDALFRDAAVEWLIAINYRPVDALNHPKFKEMVDVAARAHDGVMIIDEGGDFRSISASDGEFARPHSCECTSLF
ncbi:hypothetical protein C8R44DRAFT_651543, partial [Mycena epipterygia]